MPQACADAAHRASKPEWTVGASRDGTTTLTPLVGGPAAYVQAHQLKAVGPYRLGFEPPDHQDQGG